MANDVDRRIATREDAFLPFEIAGREEFVNDYIENLSAVGAYVRTLEPAPLRTRLKIVIVAPKSRRKFSFDAEVMRVIEPNVVRGADPPGMGIAFLDLGDGDPRPKAVEILQEMRALEVQRKQLALAKEDPNASAPLPTDAADALSRLDAFLKQATKQNYYEILGIDAGSATPATVKKHYHRRSKEFHPDRFHRLRVAREGETEDEKKRREQIDSKVEETYGLLTRAYETLKDPAKREAYDKAHGVRETVQFRRAAARARLDEALEQIAKRRLFAATIGLKVALSLDPGNPEITRKIGELERQRKFFLT